MVVVACIGLALSFFLLLIGWANYVETKLGYGVRPFLVYMVPVACTSVSLAVLLLSLNT